MHKIKVIEKPPINSIVRTNRNNKLREYFPIREKVDIFVRQKNFLPNVPQGNLTFVLTKKILITYGISIVDRVVPMISPCKQWVTIRKSNGDERDWKVCNVNGLKAQITVAMSRIGCLAPELATTNINRINFYAEPNSVTGEINGDLSFIRFKIGKPIITYAKD